MTFRNVCRWLRSGEARQMFLNNGKQGSPVYWAEEIERKFNSSGGKDAAALIKKVAPMIQHQCNSMVVYDHRCPACLLNEFEDEESINENISIDR